MSTASDRELARWASEGLTAPRRAVIGPEAAAEARAMLEAAGVDVAAVERRVGRPRLDSARPGAQGKRSPRINVAVSDSTNEAIEVMRVKMGISKSDFVRQALDSYLESAR